MTAKPDPDEQAGTLGDRQAEYEAIGADVLVEHVRDDMKTCVATLRERLRSSLGNPDDRR